MNNPYIPFVKKAALWACLFLYPLLPAHAQEWQFDAATQAQYQQVLNLQTPEVLAQLEDPKTPQQLYVASLAEALELLITEDGEKYTEYERRYLRRLDRKRKPNDPNDLFVEAEMHLQWGFVYLKYGHEFDAATSIRQAYVVSEDIRKRFPKYMAIRKTSGLLGVIIGSVPEKYDWVLTILSMSGSVDFGLDDLETLRTSGHPLAFEADLLYAVTLGFVLQRTQEAWTVMQQAIASRPDNRLALFLGASLAIKNASSEDALGLLLKLDGLPQGLPVHYAYYLQGEVYLQKAEYLNSITAYRSFINNYDGQNYIKDAYYKIALCYWLNGNKNDALTAFKQARNVGKEATEADKYAARSLADNELPHIALTRARYATDGGYYDAATRILNGIPASALPTTRDQVEFVYRKARVAHKLGDLAAAKALYQQTIDLNGLHEWYFAPNACLQLGYLALDAQDTATAKSFFNRALGYKKHEYKNSIDSKAKSALAQLNRRK